MKRKPLPTVEHAELVIERMPLGGFVVREPYRTEQRFNQQLFACTDIDDALAFIKDEIGEPEKAQPWPFFGETSVPCPECGRPASMMHAPDCTVGAS